MNIFAPLMKVDVERREVWGVLCEEAVDKSNEVFDYASSKPHFQKWNDDFSKATDGKSVGNLRSMHTNIAAGKFIAMDYDDAKKRVVVGAKVVDDNEWQKVLEGVYTGFSIGGKYLKRWHDTSANATRYTARPSEGSLVDNPCMYGATFSVVKADGVEELVKFTGGASMTDEQKARLEELLGKGDDLNDAEKAELADLQKAENPFKDGEGDKSEGGKEETGDGEGDGKAGEKAGDEKDGGEGDAEKCDKCGEGKEVCKCAAHKSESVDVDALRKSVSDEVKGELANDIQKTAESVTDLQKSVDDAVSDMQKAVQGFDDLSKSFDTLSKAHADLLGKYDDLGKSFEDLKSENGELVKRIDALEKQPAAGGAVLMSVSKGAGGEGTATDEVSVLKALIQNTPDLMAKQALSSQLAMLEMKKVHQSPVNLK